MQHSAPWLAGSQRRGPPLPCYATLYDCLCHNPNMSPLPLYNPAGVYMMLSKERAGADTFLSAALPHDAPRLPLHSEPDASYYLMGWCLVNRRLDPRITAIEFIEVRC